MSHGAGAPGVADGSDRRSPCQRLDPEVSLEWQHETRAVAGIEYQSEHTASGRAYGSPGEAQGWLKAALQTTLNSGSVVAHDMR